MRVRWPGAEALFDVYGQRFGVVPELAAVDDFHADARRLARAAVSFVSGENPYSDDRIRTELQWRPLTPAPEAIRRTVAWFLQNEKPGH